MYFFDAITFLVEATQNGNSDPIDNVIVSKTTKENSDLVSIDELDGILEFLYEIRNKEKGIVSVNCNDDNNHRDDMYKNTESAQYSYAYTTLLTNNTCSLDDCEKMEASCHINTVSSIEECTIPIAGNKQHIDINEELIHSEYTCTQPFANGQYYDNNNYEKNTTDDSYFRFILLAVFKNMAYYRFNIRKLLHCASSSLYKDIKKIAEPSAEFKKIILQKLVNLLLTFVKKPTEFHTTDISVFDSFGCCNIKEMRKSLPQGTFEAANAKIFSDSNKVILFKDLNSTLVQATKKMLKYSSFSEVAFFCNKNLGTGLLVNRYNDMCVCFVYSLYKITVFFENTLKEVFEKHLTCPPLPIDNFYNNYADIQQHAIFFWAFDWLYYFSNYCKLPTNTDSKRFMLILVHEYPQEFFIQLYLLIYFAINYQEANRFSDDFVGQIKEKIKTAIFYKEDEFCENFNESNLLTIFITTGHIYSHKIYNKLKRQKVPLIRTTEENVENANLIGISMSYVIDRIIDLLRNISIDGNKELVATTIESV